MPMAVGITLDRAVPTGTSVVRFLGTSKASTGRGSGYYLNGWGNANSPGADAFARIYTVATLAQGQTANPAVSLAKWALVRKALGDDLSQLASICSAAAPRWPWPAPE